MCAGDKSQTRLETENNNPLIKSIELKHDINTVLEGIILYHVTIKDIEWNAICCVYRVLHKCVPRDRIQTRCGTEVSGRGFIISSAYPKYYMGGQV